MLAGTWWRPSTAPDWRTRSPGPEAARSSDGSSACRTRSTSRCSRLRGLALRQQLLADAEPELAGLLAEWTYDDLPRLVQNLGGHDLGVLLDAFRADEVADRPSVVFAYTVKGWGLPVAGDPLNHSALLPRGAIDDLRRSLGLTPESEWDRFAPDTSAGSLCSAVGQLLQRPAPTARPVVNVPISVLGSSASSKPVSSQEAFGRLLLRLADQPDVRSRIVTTSPDVSVSTNLGGWINKVGVFHPDEQPDFLGDGRLLRWKQTPAGRHIELGISEMNLFLLLHALGLGHELHGQHLLPIGTVYDPFVCRGLDALIYALYNGARFVLAGTPAGVTLAPEGGAHQSAITPSIGLELPDLTYAEPCYAQALDWLLCDGLARLSGPAAESLYLRLSTRPIDQAPFAEVMAATRGGRPAAVTSSPAGTGCGRAALGRRRSSSPRAAPSYPRYSPPRACSRPRGCPRSSWTSRVRAGCTRSGGGRCGAPAAAPALPHRRSTSRASSSRMSDACRS